MRISEQFPIRLNHLRVRQSLRHFPLDVPASIVLLTGRHRRQLIDDVDGIVLLRPGKVPAHSIRLQTGAGGLIAQQNGSADGERLGDNVSIIFAASGEKEQIVAAEHGRHPVAR